MCDFAHDNRGKEGTSKDGQIGEGHADTALVDAVQVTDSGIEQTFEWSGTDALEGAGRSEAVVMRYLISRLTKRGISSLWREVAGSATPGAGKDDKDDANQEQMAFAPNATRGNEEDCSATSAEKIVAR